MSPTVDAEALRIIEAFVAELGGRCAVGADDLLDRDPGIGSLERVELLLRLEHAFGMRFADAVLAEARTPRDLIDAVIAGGPAVPERPTAPHAPLPAGVAAPAASRTLIDVLRWHAETTGERSHIILHDGDDRQTITYGQLWERARRLAVSLRERGLAPGERVALMLRTEPAFFDAFFGVLIAGGIPVPIPPPFRFDRLEEYASRQVGTLLRARVASLHEVVVAERPLNPAAGGEVSNRADPDDTALIQYTSGSTGDPKGVVLSHANLLANIRAIGHAIGIGPADVAVSWLPLYHDMGLIGCWLGALYFGVPIAIMSPLAFLSRPVRWLRAIHEHRAPSFR